MPDKRRPIVVYCAAAPARRSRRRRSRSSGTRASSTSPAATPNGSATALPTQLPRALAPQQRSRYSRHLLIPEVGEEGQLKLLDSRILLIGAGGLGSPASLYLAAAGVGHARDRRRRRRRRDEPAAPDRPLDRAARRAEGRVREAHDRGAQPRRDRQDLPGAPHLRERRPDPRRGLGRDRRRRRQLPDALPAERRIGLARDPRRPRLDLPLRGPGDGVQAPQWCRDAGEAGIAHPEAWGPCYRCLFPQPPPPELAPSCAEGGVLGVLPGVVGSIQATEALKLALGIGDPLVGPAAALRRARRIVHRGQRSAATRPARCAETTRRSPSTSTTSSSAAVLRPTQQGGHTHESSDPPHAARRHRRRARGARLGRDGRRTPRRPDCALPGARGPARSSRTSMSTARTSVPSTSSRRPSARARR